MSSSNRKQRRAHERLQRARRSSTAEAAEHRIGAAQAEVQRLTLMYRACQEAGSLASSISVVEKPDGWTEEDGDPNAFRQTAIEDFSERLTETRERLILAHEEMYLALEAIDPSQPSLIQLAAPTPPVVA